MDFRRSGQLDERRRRVLMDEIASPGESDKPAPTGVKGPVRAYSEAVLADRQRRVSEFIPVRPFQVVAIILLMLTAVAAIEALYIFTAPPGGHVAAVHKSRQAVHAFAALDLAARGNLGSWFSSLLFAGGTLTILGMLAIRAHRVDDYRGRYRVWWWVAAAFAFASVDTATGLHDSLGEAGQLLAGDSLPGGRTLLWIGVYGLVFGTLGIRAAFEIWSSLLAVTFGSLAALAYFACIALQLEVIPLEAGNVLRTVISSSVLLAAHVLLVSAVMLYARHVHLDAQGRLLVSSDPAARPKKKSKSKAKLAIVSDDDSEVTTTVKNTVKEKNVEPQKDELKRDEPKKEPAPIAKSATAAPALKFGSSTSPQASASISAKPAPARPVDSDDEDEDEEDDERMSKSDRKRLKKLARREQQQGRRAA